MRVPPKEKSKQTVRRVHSQGEKVLQKWSWGEVGMQTTSGVALWCCAVRACDSSIWAPSRCSVLSHRLHCHNKITGGHLDSRLPQGVFVDFLLSKFGGKTSFPLQGKSSERLEDGKASALLKAETLKLFSCTRETEITRRANVSFRETTTRLSLVQTRFRSHSSDLASESLEESRY